MWRDKLGETLAKRMVDVQNEALPPEQLRTLNDEINKLIRLMRGWEV